MVTVVVLGACGDPTSPSAGRADQEVGARDVAPAVEPGADSQALADALTNATQDPPTGPSAGVTPEVPASGGASPPPEVKSAPQPPSPSSARPDNSILPGIEVDDVGAGSRVNLATFAPADKPLLVWFWAPH
ncbi:MAG: hypothetical protein ACT4OS_05910 [Acidimicrobiales bacterium]